MRVIITGGSGLIGSELASDLVKNGHEAIILSRNPDKHSGKLPNGVRLERWDGYSAAGWGHLVDGAEAIVNLAGENLSAGRWTQKRKHRIRQSRRDAGQAVVQAVEQAANKPKVVIQSSGVGYYGTHEDEIITEKSPPGDDFLSRICIEWEDSTAEVEAMGVRRAVIRSGVVLSMEGGALPRMLLPYRFFVGGPIGSGKQWFPWIHIADEVGAIRFLIKTPDASGAFNLAAPNPVTNRQLARNLGKVLRRPAAMPVPAVALKLVFGEMAMVLLEGQRAVPMRLEEAGFVFRYPIVEDALRNLLNR